MQPSGDDWYLQISSLIWSTLGRITNNFRLVSLRFDGDEWKLRIVLEQDSKSDYEEIEELFEDYVDKVWDNSFTWREDSEAVITEAVDCEIIKEVEVIPDGVLEVEQQDQYVWIYRRKE